MVDALWFLGPRSSIQEGSLLRGTTVWELSIEKIGERHHLRTGRQNKLSWHKLQISCPWSPPKIQNRNPPSTIILLPVLYWTIHMSVNMQHVALETIYLEHDHRNVAYSWHDGATQRRQKASVGAVNTVRLTVLIVPAAAISHPNKYDRLSSHMIGC